MPRRLILGILIVLIVGMIAGTVVLVIQRLRSNTSTDTTEVATSTPVLLVASEGTQRLAEEDPNGDADQDGLINADEALWGTDAYTADTDGDGYLDGDEVTNQHNPTIAGPNDTLPDNYEPGQDLQALDLAPLQVDQYFESDLDLYAEKSNLTEAYTQTHSTEETTTANMIAYAQTQSIITKLPTVQESAIQTTTDNSTLTLSLYLNQARSIQQLSDSQTLSKALDELYTNNNTARIDSMSLQVRQYQQSLFDEKAPTTAVALHKLLLGYTELLAATLDEIALWNTDPIRSLVALQQLDTIDRQYYPLITQEIERLANSVE